MYASEGAAAAGSTPLEALMAGRVLRDGELVLLLLRPSRWFILLSSLKFLAIVLILMILAVVFDERLHYRSRQYVEIGGFLMAGRLMWGVLQWMGRLFILTDLRIIRLSGVFSINSYECPLRKVARTLLERTFKEQLVRIGTIVIVPQEEEFAIGYWQMVPRPKEVQQRIATAVSRAKQGGVGG
jgi:hypothetical protein